MNNQTATRAFAALGHDTRLRIFRRLLQEGPNGLAAGAIAALLDVPPSTLSTHLAVLETAGLVGSHRVSRQIYYAASIEGTRALLAFLTEECCDGRPDLCGGLMEFAKDSETC